MVDHSALQRKKHSMIAHAQPITITLPLKFSYVTVKIVAQCLNALADLVADSFIESAQLSHPGLIPPRVPTIGSDRRCGVCKARSEAPAELRVHHPEIAQALKRATERCDAQVMRDSTTSQPAPPSPLTGFWNLVG
jgi:hypothetical protein